MEYLVLAYLRRENGAFYLEGDVVELSARDLAELQEELEDEFGDYFEAIEE